MNKPRDRERLETLMLRLKDSDRGVRAYAAMALGEIGDQRATKSLTRLLHDRSRTVRLSVIHALVELRDPRAVGALESAADRTSPLHRAPYTRGLRKLREALR